MSDPSLSPTPQDLWRNQPVPSAPVTLEEIHRRAARSRTRLRRRGTLRIVAAVLALACNCAVLLFPGPYAVLFSVLTMTALVVQLTDLPRAVVANRLRREPLTLGLSSEPPSCLDAYRRELEVQRDFNEPLRQQAVFVGLFGLVLALLGARRTAAAIPLGATQMIAAAVWYYRVGREAPFVRRELEELEAFRRGE